MTLAAGPVLRAVRAPHGLQTLDPPGWDDTLRAVRNAGLLPRVAAQLHAEPQLPTDLPTKVQDHLAAARQLAGQHERVVRWEVNRIAKALHPLDTKVVLLKGAAYVMAELPNSRGRLVTDVDILVPKARINDAERALAASGWKPMKLDAYDQRYYRQWMHELPPMQHAARGTVIDVHHTILPESGRLTPDPQYLLNDARSLPDHGLYVLSPHDMVLHSAVHLFQDGDFAGGLRDLLDIDDMLRHFGAAEPDFWPGLVDRATELTLHRPLYYALRFARRLLDTPVPDDVASAARVGRPPAPVIGLMDALVTRALVPFADADRPTGVGLSQWLLYVRSHWLRMPPLLLAGHLLRKAMRRLHDDVPQ